VQCSAVRTAGFLAGLLARRGTHAEAKVEDYSDWRRAVYAIVDTAYALGSARLGSARLGSARLGSARRCDRSIDRSATLTDYFVR
jgi:hypothetical protein